MPTSRRTFAKLLALLPFLPRPSMAAPPPKKRLREVELKPSDEPDFTFNPLTKR